MTLQSSTPVRLCGSRTSSTLRRRVRCDRECAGPAHQSARARLHQANVTIVPKDVAFDFMLLAFQSQALPLLDVT